MALPIHVLQRRAAHCGLQLGKIFPICIENNSPWEESRPLFANGRTSFLAWGVVSSKVFNHSAKSESNRITFS